VPFERRESLESARDLLVWPFQNFSASLAALVTPQPRRAAQLCPRSPCVRFLGFGHASLPNDHHGRPDFFYLQKAQWSSGSAPLSSKSATDARLNRAAVTICWLFSSSFGPNKPN
jgi:hypothetical protein